MFIVTNCCFFSKLKLVFETERTELNLKNPKPILKFFKRI